MKRKKRKQRASTRLQPNLTRQHDDRGTPTKANRQTLKTPHSSRRNPCKGAPKPSLAQGRVHQKANATSRVGTAQHSNRRKRVKYGVLEEIGRVGDSERCSGPRKPNRLKGCLDPPCTAPETARPLDGRSDSQPRSVRTALRENRDEDPLRSRQRRARGPSEGYCAESESTGTQADEKLSPSLTPFSRTRAALLICELGFSLGVNFLDCIVLVVFISVRSLCSPFFCALLLWLFMVWWICSPFCRGTIRLPPLASDFPDCLFKLLLSFLEVFRPPSQPRSHLTSGSSFILWPASTTCCSLASHPSMEANPKSFKEALFAEPSSEQNLTEQASGEPTPQAHKATHADEAKTNSEQTTDKEPNKVSNKGKEKIDQNLDISAYLGKLAKARQNIQVIKDTALMGIVIGDKPDLAKLRTKLRAEWRSIKGEINLVERANGWFDIRFSNPFDQKRIWEGRPYHVFGNLLLLRPWKSSFDPSTENTNLVDMWIRIPFFPIEFINPEAIQIILQYNKLGNFIKLDPFSEKKLRVKYTRICISFDLSWGIIDRILVPDENDNIREFPVWYEEFPKGCGNCGEPEHLFENCPQRKYEHPKMHVFYRNKNEKVTTRNQENKAKEPAVNYMNREEGGDSNWKTVSRDKKKPQTDQTSTLNKNIPTNTPPAVKHSPTKPPPDAANKYVTTSKPEQKSTQAGQKEQREGEAHGNQESTKHTQAQPKTNDNMDEEEAYEDDEEEFFEDEEYTAGQLEEALKKDDYSMNEAMSENSTHSLQYNHPVVKKMEVLVVKKDDISTSSSNKRKNAENAKDTASSYQRRKK